MDFSLTEEQRLLTQEARQFLAQEWPSATMRRMLGAGAADASAKLWEQVAQLGWAGLRVPEEHEGLGAGVFDLAVLLEETGRALVPGELWAATLAAEALIALGSAEAQAQRLPAIAEGRERAALALSEPGNGWGLAVPSDSRCEKTLVSNAAGADVLLAVVRTGEDRVELRLVRDAEIEPLRTLDPTRPLDRVRFELTAAETLGSGTVADLEQALDRATVALAAEMVGGCQALLDMTVDYVKHRKQFGVPVGAFQAVQHRAADMLAHVEKARSAVRYAALVADEQAEDLGRAASTAKVCANQAYICCSQQAIQLHGGIGFTWEQDLHLYFKRAKASEVTLGDTPFHLDRIAAQIITQ